MKNLLFVTIALFLFTLECADRDTQTGVQSGTPQVRFQIDADVQANSKYEITITASDMTAIGPTFYPGGQKISIYVPEGAYRMFHFRRFNSSDLLTDTAVTTMNIGSGVNVVTVALVAVKAPLITNNPITQAVTIGTTATFGTVATGTKPFTYKWQKNSTDIAGAMDSSYTTLATTIDDNGSAYRCIISNIVGSVISEPAILTVNRIKPEISGDPQSATVTVGQTAIFGVIATGTKPFVYKWQKNGSDLSGATDSSYKTPATIAGDSGSTFRCIVSNSAGGDTSAAALLKVTTDVIKPEITGDPQPVSVNVGQTATFGVVATGTKPFTYKWQKNNADISGATDSSYTTPVTIAGDSGLTFRCIVSNSAGGDTSAVALLKVYTVDSITDIDGNVYHTVRIGNQVWTVENLRTTKYNDGTSIPLVTDNTAWCALTTSGYCYYNNTTNIDSIKKYGALYNWYVVNPENLKKIAPAGWHVPSDVEWDTLRNYLIANGYNWDGTTTGNEIAKAMATKTDWSASTTAGAIGNDLMKNNNSGFSALPGGCRDGSTFAYIGDAGSWWSATEYDATYAWNRGLLCGNSSLLINYHNKRYCGFSLRLVRD
jgi:uncharacterized protein (TIGR02145 family)